MIKPLLKVIPALSGNLKLACTLSNYQQIDDNTFKATSKSARIYPLSSNSFQSLIDINLYTSSWEYDVCKYYKVYSDIFYKDTFTFDKNNLLYCNDLSSVINDRNSEFEFGCKRVSYEKTGKQLAFFAPIYCDSIEDLPDSFEIELNIHNEDIYNVTKKIIVDLTDTKNNYLYIYLKRYLTKVDDNIIFMQPKTKQATYYGIDVRVGGFNKYVDNIISKIFSEETTINGFDALISGGFKRNGLIMKQIIPLAFYFSANDILNDFEQLKLTNASINIKGVYVKNNNNIPFYMIDDNYDSLSLKTLVLNTDTGDFEYKYNFSNILDIQDNTAVSVKNVEEYKYSNKLNKTYNRWMLKYSDINAPYITNNNYVFSKNQLLNNLYYEYPQNYYPTSLFCEMDNTTNNINLILPIGDNITIGAPYYNYTDITNRYKLSLNNYINNWFDITNEKTLDYILEHTNWHDIHNTDNKIFYKGLLYDFNNIYKSFELEDTIDKFAILLYINDDKLYTNENISNYIYSSSVMTNNNSNTELNLENNVYSNIYLSCNSSYNTVSLYDLNIVDENNEYKPNYLYDTNKYFTYNEYGLGKYVDINSLGLNFYEINKYYAISEEYKNFDIDESEIIESFELLPIYYINNIIDLINNKMDLSINSLLNNIYYTSTNTVLKNKLSEFNDIKNADPTIFENYIFYYKRLFISYNKYNYYSVEKQINIDSIIYKENNNIVNFLYYPKYITDTNKEISNIFVRKDPHNCFYGNDVPFSYISIDNDVLYIDPYNIKDILTNTYYLDCSLYISNVYDTNNKQFTYITLSNITLNDDNYKDNIITVKSSYTNKAYVLDLLNYTSTYFNQDKYDYNKFNVDNIIKKINGLTYCSSVDDINYNTNIQFNVNGNIYKYNLINSSISNIVIEENLLDNILNINTVAYVKNIDFENNKIYINTLTNQNTTNSYEFILQCSPDNIYKYGYLTGAMTYIIDRYIINSNRIGTYFNGDTSYSGIFGNYPQKIITAINNLHYDSALNDLFTNKYNIDLTDDIEFVIEQSTLNKEKIENPTTYITLNNNININNINITKGDYLYNVSPYITDNEYYAKIKDKEALNIFKQYINQYAINDENIVKDNKSSLTDSELLNYIYVKKYYINEQGNVYVVYDSLNKCFTDDIKITQNKDYLFNIIDNKNNIYEYELYFKKMFIKLTKEIYNNIIALDDIHSKYNDLYIYRLEHNNDMVSNVKYNFDNDNIILNTVTYNTVKTISESLFPLFNSIFKEDKYNTVIYKDRILDKLNSVVFSNTEYTYTLYRSNNYDMLMLYDVTGIMTYTDGKFTNIQPGTYSFIYDTLKYNITYNSYSGILNDTTYTTTYLNDMTVTYTYTASKIKTFDIFSNTTPNIINITNNNELYNKYKLNVYKKGDTTYGFYLIEMNISNLNNTFNLIEYYNGNTNYESIKYFTHINNINIIDNHYNLSKLFKLIIPALNINILNALYSIPILVKQHKSIFNKKYKNIIENGKKHIVLINNDYKQSITLYRYFDNIIPYIVESNNIFTEYVLKVKTLQNVTFTDDVMYNIHINIYNYPGIRIYKDENNYSVIKQLEYKYYNDNMFINLEDEFSIHISDSLTYDDLLKYQNNKIIVQYFTKYINKYKKIHFNDTEILFLYKKYNVLLLSYHNKLNYNFNEKLYSLTYKFKLK